MIRNEHDYAATAQVKRQNCSQPLDIPRRSSQYPSPSLPQELQTGCAHPAVLDANGSTWPVFLYSHVGPKPLQSTILMAEQRHTVRWTLQPEWKGNEAQVNAPCGFTHGREALAKEESQIRSPSVGGVVKVTEGEGLFSRVNGQGTKGQGRWQVPGEEAKVHSHQQGRGEHAWRPTAGRLGPTPCPRDWHFPQRTPSTGPDFWKGEESTKITCMPPLLKPFFRVIINTCGLPRWC